MLLITLMQDKYINTTVLPDKKKGHYKINHSMDFLDEEINVDGVEDSWIISSGQKYKIINEKESFVTINNNDVITIEVENPNGTNEKCTLIVETISDEKNKFTKFCLTNSDFDIHIGKNPDNDIVLKDSYVSGHHAVISNRNNSWKVVDTESKNGTYVNNVKIPFKTEVDLNVGDVVFIVGYKFIICYDFISANIEFENSVKSAYIIKTEFDKFDESIRRNKKEYEPDYFYRTINLENKKPDFEEIVVLPPEHKTIKEDNSSFASMGSAFTMSTATLLVAGYSALAAYYRGTNMSYVVPSFIMAGSMLLSTLFWPSILRKKKKAIDKQEEEKRANDYMAYIIQLRATVSTMLDKEKEYLASSYMSADECMNSVIENDKYLWSKSINDSDFLLFSIGKGEIASSIVIKDRNENTNFIKDDLIYNMIQFTKEKRVITDAPVSVSLNNGCIFGINGNSDQAYNFIKSIVIQLTSLFSYDELKLVFIYNENESDKWEYAKWLPHVWNSDGTVRYIASSSHDIKELSSELEKEIDARQTRKNEDFPKMVIVAADKKTTDKLDIMPVILKNNKELNFSLLTSFGMYNYNNSDIIIELSGDKSKIYDRNNNTSSEFEPYNFNEDNFVKYLDAISNIKLDISTEKYQLPKMLTFLDMFKVSKVEHLNSLSRWTENNPIKSLKTEIGVSTSGDTFYIDMHEKFHGPHGLIAGTTGSGKSESIITVILSLAVNYSPEEVAFVIVDYKGGGLADAFNDVKEEIIDGKTVEVKYKLPHVIGTVTNLDGSTIERACISIDTELKRRQKLFKIARKISNEGTMDIYKYQQLRREGASLEPLPHLFIVCDEFAELKADRSDFMDLLVSAARIGRSLGIHLILATQKPDSVVSPQIWSNSRFKICLKVQGKEDSTAVIHRPDAAEISTTGRFFFQVGYNEVFSMGQSAWCGADYIKSENFIKSDTESVEIISNTGSVLYEKVRKSERVALAENERTVSQLIAVRDYLIDIAKDIDMRPLWLDPIPAKLSIRELYSEYTPKSTKKYNLEPVIGKRDDLYNRIQEIMTIPFSTNGNLIVYGSAGSGLDMFFISVMYSMIYNYTAEQVNIYALDFDAGFLKAFSKAPQVGDVVTADEDDSVSKILFTIKDEIARRSKLFAEYRGEYSEYCEHSGKTLPNIVLIINNYTAFAEKFDESHISALINIAREGTRRGIYLVIGTLTVSMNHRLRQYINQIYMLKMNDVNEYMAILGRTGGITPSGSAGNGIVKENNITYKFQTADIFDIPDKSDDAENISSNDASKEIKLLCEEAIKNNEGMDPAVTFQHVQVSKKDILKKDFEYSSVPVGVDEEDNIFEYNFKDKYITFISSDSRELLTEFADYISHALAKDKNISVNVIDPSGNINHEKAKFSYYSTIEEFESWNQKYKNIVEERCSNLKKVSDGVYILDESFAHIYVIINGYNEATSIKDGNITFNNFKNIINELPEAHIHYIILDTPGDMNAARGAYIHIVKNIADITNIDNFDIENNREWFDNSGIWLGKGLTKQSLFDIGDSNIILSSNDGVIIRNRKAETKFNIFTE